MSSSQRLTFFGLLAAGLLAGAVADNPGRASPDGTIDAIRAATSAFVAKLDTEGRSAAAMPFDSEERFNWHFVPRERNGLPLRDMNPDQRKAAHRLMQTTLSSTGYLKATGIMQLERILGVIENRPERRDPEGYFVTVFGDPSAEAPWAWRLEGHHLALNFTVVGDELSTTPAFMGSNPATVPSGPFAGWRVLGAEEDIARSLLHMLDESQRAEAIIATEAPRDIVTGNDRTARLEGFEGLSASDMTSGQRAVLLLLVAEYVGNVAHDQAEVQMDAIRQAGVERLYFAWAGSTEPGAGHYYRVHGPTVLIEYDNTQGNANHVHSVWRNLQNDFGDDLLRRHYEESH